VAAGGPTTLPDANLFTNGAWYGGSPYLGPNATVRATGCKRRCFRACSRLRRHRLNTAVGHDREFTQWRSRLRLHVALAQRAAKITTNNIFPGGMLMMMLVDSREFVIDESN